MENIYDSIHQAMKNSEQTALCTIVSTKGSTPLKTGSKMLVYSSGKIVNTIGGGSLEKNVIDDALNVINAQQAKLIKYDLLKQLEMCCGGSVEIFIEPIINKKKLLIFGAGHIGSSLANYAKDFNFDISIIDNRKEFIDQLQIENVVKNHLHHTQFLNTYSFSENTFIVICTYKHSYDREVLAQCITQKVGYIGMIGSKRKVLVTKKMFLEKNMASQNQLDFVDMPMGVDINAHTHQEIAISILAKLIQVHNKKDKRNEIEGEELNTEYCNQLLQKSIQ